MEVNCHQNCLDRSLEGHTRLFLEIANHTNYPDDALCAFCDASLNTECKAPSSENGPREDFAAFLDWILARNGSPLTICPEEDLASSTPDSEPCPLSPCCAEPKPAATDEPQHGATVLRITVEPELLITSDQVREPATTPATRERAVESESAERSSAHCAMAEGDLNANLGLLDSEGGVLDVYVDLPRSSLLLQNPLSLLFPRPAQKETPFPSSDKAGLLFPRPAQKETLFPSQARQPIHSPALW